MKPYKVDYTIYATKTTETFLYDSWDEALCGYIIVSSNIIQDDWTRHNSCQEEISHMDMKHNLFNEGAVRLSPNIIPNE